MLNSLQLIDTWRFLHPDTRDFTFLSIPHNRYSQIDYLFITQQDLQTVTGANLGIQSLSDHAPVSLRIDLGLKTPRTHTRRLNASLLTDQDLLLKIKSSLSEYFHHNTNLGIDPMMVWQAHKCSIKGWTNQIRIKKEETKQEHCAKELTNKIRRLENCHKHCVGTTWNVQSPTGIVNWDQNQKTAIFFFFFRKKLYETGDNTGRFLARALKRKPISSTTYQTSEHREGH